MRNYRFCILCGLAAALIALLLSFASPATAADAPVSFIAEVAPILKENCFACHDAKKKAGKYDMTTFEKLLAGGDDGEAIVPGKPAESDLHELIITADARRMPPRDKGGAVPAAKAEILKKWIAQGAKLDAGLDPQTDLVAELRRRWSPPAPPKAYRLAVPVNALAFTPDGKQIVANGHHELTVWNIENAKLVKRLCTRAERAYGLAFLPGGLLAVAGGRPGQEGDLCIYDLNAAAKETIDGVAMLDGVADRKVLVKKIFDADDSILCLAVSSDGRKLAAGGTDRIVRLWDVNDPLAPKLEQSVENHADWVLGVAFTADGKFLYTAGRDKTAKVWDLAKKESILTVPEHQAIVYGVAAKADGTLGYSVGADRQLRSWKPNADGKPSKNSGTHGDEVYRVLVHPAKNVVFTAGADKTVRAWDASEKLAPLRNYQGLNDVIYALALSADGTLLAAGAYDGEVRIWNSETAALAAAFNASPGFKSPAAVKP